MKKHTLKNHSAADKMLLYTGIMIWLILYIMMVFSGTVQAGVSRGQILPESAMRVLTIDEIEDMPLQVIAYAKNEIYARNGRMFRSQELQNYFSAQSWYTPLYQPDKFTADMLNTYELHNLELLSDRESLEGPYQLDQEDYSYDVIYEWQDANVPVRSGYETDPVSEIFYDSDRRNLESEELNALTVKECYYASCEIYARHGMIFSSREISDYFGQKNWYWGFIGESDFDESVLSTVEQDNLQALKEAMEKKDEQGYVTDQEGFSYAGIGSYTAGKIYVPGEDDFIFTDSSIAYLTDEEVSRLSLRQLCYARNEIYARRGVIFLSRELREFFRRKCWYHPVLQAFVLTEDHFNEIERANLNLLRDYEFSISADGYQLY